jgi:transcription factor E2F7/8
MDAFSSFTAAQIAAASAAAETSPAPTPPLSFPQPLRMFADGAGAQLRHHAYSRKQKSLGLLCSK